MATKNTTSQYKYGDQVKDSSGKVIGTAKFNENTGEPLKQSSSSKSSSSTKINDPFIESFNKSMVTGIVGNQSNLVQDTLTEKFKQNKAATKIDNKLQEATGIYGTPVKDQGGNVIGYEQYDSKTGKPLKKPDETTTPEGNMEDSMGNKYFSSMPKDMTYKLPEPTVAGNKWVFDDKGKPYEMDAKGNVTTNLDAEQQYNINQQANKDIETQNTLYDQLKKNVSAAHQVVIDNIKQKAQIQKTQMEDMNKRYLASKTVAGFRTGSTEYTPEIAMGILKAEEEEGLKRIQEIDDNMTIALAEAVSAKNNDELDVAQQKFDTYSKLQKEKETAIIDQYKMYLDNQKYIDGVNKALETENRAREDQAMQKLKASADAYVKGYASAKDKDAYIQSLATSLGLDPDIILGQILNATPKPKTTSTTSGKKTVTETKANAIGEMATGMSSIAGEDGYIDPQVWISARKKWIEKGFVDADFLKNFKQYLNPESYKLVPEFAPKKTTTAIGRNS